jgi:hypothetical protein
MVLGQASPKIKFIGGYLQMTTEQKDAVKSLFFGALDFMYGKFDEKTLNDYIFYCKTQLTENYEISISEFNEWVEEWEVN